MPLPSSHFFSLLSISLSPFPSPPLSLLTFSQPLLPSHLSLSQFNAISRPPPKKSTHHATRKIPREIPRQPARVQRAPRQIRRLAELVAAREGESVRDGKNERDTNPKPQKPKKRNRMRAQPPAQLAMLRSTTRRRCVHISPFLPSYSYSYLLPDFRFPVFPLVLVPSSGSPIDKSIPPPLPLYVCQPPVVSYLVAPCPIAILHAYYLLEAVN